MPRELEGGRGMPRPYLEAGFFDPAACARVRAAMDQGATEAAGILRGGTALDRQVRHAAHVEVDPGTLAFVESRLDAHRARLAEWFRHPLAAREGAGFLRYGPGGFYRPHRDRGSDPSWPGAVRRRVAIVLFLTACRGGALRLLDEEDGRGDVNVVPAEGALVAFPADTLHEVAPVEAGTRDVVVDWFY
jgi:predicted 2-oxoglutarate/Fe(II)-dependent dioxygenase YbiX